MEYVENISIQQNVADFLRKKNRSRTRGGLRMTAMIDVIFLLLAFFVLTARFRAPEQFLPAALVSADTAIQSPGIVEPLAITIRTETGGCVILLNDTAPTHIDKANPQAALAVFADRLQAALQSQRRTTADPVEILCDDQVQWDHLIKIYNILYAMGISDITFGASQ
jgi:biopolymer transport protein ExbD